MWKGKVILEGSNVKANMLFVANNFVDIDLTTMKSLLAPKTRISRGQFGVEGTGRDAFSFLKSNNGILELSFISS